MGRIIAIGGGELSKGETYAIDQEIIKLSGQTKPKTLFVPTASFEPAGYCESFKNLYENELGAEVDVLYLLDNQLTISEIEDKIKWADIIYVGGGDTVHMLKVWKSKNVDQLFREAYKHGTLLCGLSAGSICWFKYGQSEIESDSSEDGFEYIQLDGLGLLNAFHCPHFDEGRRSKEFFKMIKTSDDIGIALENNCAIAIIDETYRILTSKPNQKAYKVYRQNEQVVCEPIEEISHFRPLKELLF